MRGPYSVQIWGPGSVLIDITLETELWRAPFVGVRAAEGRRQRQPHREPVINSIDDLDNLPVSLVALTHRGRYDMNILSRRSVLAIASVVDVALHSR
jgi:hypothetical protein